MKPIAIGDSEFKVCHNDTELEKVANEGMNQIYRRKYYSQMQNQGIKEIWLYSMAFCKKKMFMKKEKLEI